jgi:protein involved in polysaccharide export with SLBB domain
MSRIILIFLAVVATVCGASVSFAQTHTDQIASQIPMNTSASSSVTIASPSDKMKNDARQYYKAGVKYGRAKLFEEAAASFLRAVRLKPDYGDAYYGLGHALFDLKRWKASIEALEKAVKINPKDEEAYSMLGKAYLNLSREGNHDAPIHASEGQKVALEISAVNGGTTQPATISPNNNLPTNIYQVGAGDVLDVRLQNSPSAEQTLFTVAVTGLLEHPILSEPLKVIGLTTEEIARRIEFDLKRRAINENPQVFLAVREYASHTVLISGLVKEPGTKILRREAIPLYVVIADAQPLPEAARAIVKSHKKGEAVFVDLTDSKAMDLLVYPGDVITLDRNPLQFFYIGGEVNVPGEKPFRARLTLTQAILCAGGVNKKGKKAELARENAPGILGLTKYKLKDIYAGQWPDPEILPGDRIMVNH